MNDNQYLIGDLVAEFLERNAIQTVFGIVSVHNIPIMNGIRRRAGMRMVMTRGETGAAHMADGFSRASQGTGAVISSTGPGAANAVPGLVEARFAGSPVLHITGQTATPLLDRGQGPVHDVPDQLGMLRASGKAAYRVRSAATALGVLKQALQDARTAPMGPVSVEIPIDIQRMPASRPAHDGAFLVPQTAPHRASDADIQRLADCLRQARRPLLWVGAGARQASAEITALLDMGLGMVSSWAGRGIASDDHPGNLGALNGPGLPMVQDLYAQSDLMLVLGSRLRGHETLDMALTLPQNLVQVDIDPQAEGRTYASRLFICGDIADTLGRLLAHLRDQPPKVAPDFPSLVAQTKQQAIAAFRDTLGPYRDFPRQLQAVMPSDALWVRDITLSNSTWGHRLLPLRQHCQNIYPIGAGIGQGLQLGIGAALGSQGRKTIMMTGDGGFFFNMTELWTAVQERADIVMIVMNDGGYGVIKHMQDAMCDGQHAYGDLLAPDLMKLAALADMPAWRVSSADQFGDMVAQAIGTPGPTLVEVDMLAIGPFPPYYPYSEMIAKARKTAKKTA